MTTPCPHHWRIAEPNGPKSPGTCKNCGATRTFDNWITDDAFFIRERAFIDKAELDVIRASHAYDR